MKTCIIVLAAAASAAAAFGQQRVQPKRAEVREVLAIRAAAGEQRDAALDQESLRRMRAGDEFIVAMEDETRLARVDRLERRSATSYSVFARLDDDPEARVILSSVNGVVAGTIRSPAQRMQLALRTRPDGTLVARPIAKIVDDECGTETDRGRRFPSPAQDADADSEGGAAATTALDNCSDQPTVTYDVLVLYTVTARDEAGGTDQMLAEIQLAVDTTNQAYEDSFQGLRARLVFAYGTEYAESIDHEADRDNLADPDDGLMDNAHGFRDLYGADFVVLIVGDVNDGCGIAFCTPSGSGEGFCVVKRSCASDNWTFAHEIGHLQGLAHNREDAGTGCNHDCYSYGHRFTGDDGVGYRTVMSYDNDAQEFERIGIFSNPYVFWQGVACGESWGDCDDDEFNVQTMSNTAFSRENWRNPKFNVWIGFDFVGKERGTYVSPWNTLAEGQTALFEGDAPDYSPPQIWLMGGTTGETLTLDKRMTVRACGTATIGQ